MPVLDYVLRSASEGIIIVPGCGKGGWLVLGRGCVGNNSGFNKVVLIGVGRT
jgi:hypothetical protein